MAGGLCCCLCFDVLVLVMKTAFLLLECLITTLFVWHLGLFVCYIVQLTLIFDSRLWLGMGQWKSSWVNNCTSWFKAPVEEKNVFVAIKKDSQNPAWKLFLSFHTFWSLCFLKNLWNILKIFLLQRFCDHSNLLPEQSKHSHWPLPPQHRHNDQHHFTYNIIKRCAKQHRERGLQ